VPLQVRVRGGLVYSVQGLEVKSMHLQVNLSRSGARTSPLPGITQPCAGGRWAAAPLSPHCWNGALQYGAKPRLVWLVCAQEECHFAVLACAWLARATLSVSHCSDCVVGAGPAEASAMLPRPQAQQAAPAPAARAAGAAQKVALLTEAVLYCML